MNFLDLILVLVLIWGAGLGYRRGAASLLAGWIAYLVGGLLAISYAWPLAEAAEQIFQIRVGWGCWLEPYLPFPRQMLDQPISIQAVQQTETLLNGLPMQGLIRQSLLNNLGKYSGATIGQALAGEIVFLFIKLLAVVFLFYGSIFVLRYLTRRGFGISNFLFLRLINRGLGLALGFLGMFFWLAVLVGMMRSFLILPVVAATPGFLPLARQLYSSETANFLVDFYNWMLSLLHILLQ